MRRYSRAAFLGLSLVTLALLLAAAIRSRAPETRQLEYMPTATIKDLMDSIVDPSADVVWNSVTTVVSSTGDEERVPRSDEDWANVRHGAIRLVEAANLLLMPGRHVARPGEKSETPGVELEPQEMEALVSQDRDAWNARARSLHDVSMEALQAIDAKDAGQLFEIGDRLDKTCESCHRQFWYPNERIPEFPATFTSIGR